MKYNLPMRALHWITALIMLFTFVAVWAHEDFKELMIWHKALGLAVLAFTLIRILIKSLSKSPITDIKAKIGHGLLYLIMILTPVTMLIASAYHKGLTLWGIEIIPLIEENKEISHALKEVHEACGTFLLILIFGHIAMAIYHHVVKKDDTISRML